MDGNIFRNSSSSNILTNIIKENVETVSHRIHLSEIQNLPSPATSSDAGLSTINHWPGSGTPLKHTPSPRHYKMKITPLSRNRRLQDLLYEKHQSTPPTGSGACYNPFEICAERFQLPTVSPQLFKEVVSPSTKEDATFAWSIDQLAMLHPTNIETSPFNQIDMPIDPEYEKKAQEAIDRYFSTSTVVPSPWANNPHSLNIMSALLSSGSSSLHSLTSTASPAFAPSLPTLKKEVGANQASLLQTATVWSQTELTLPPILSEEVEKSLAPFCTFFQDQTQQQEELDEAANMNNTTLRRKLLFNNEELANATPLCSPKNDSICLEGNTENGYQNYKEPLPFEEDETIYPWGVSVIRPSSRMSRSQSPSSNSFIRCSLGEGEELCSSPTNENKSLVNKISITPKTREASPVSLRGVSPIKCCPSLGSQDLSFSSCRKSSYCKQTIHSISQEKILKPLAVITNEPVITPVPFRSSQLSSSIIDLAHSQCSSCNSSLLQIHCASADSSISKLPDEAEAFYKGNAIPSEDEVDNNNHGDENQSDNPISTGSSSDSPINILLNNFETSPSRDKKESLTSARNSEELDYLGLRSSSPVPNKERTPSTKRTPTCHYSKSSPQFSSSPIKVDGSGCSFHLNMSVPDETDGARLKSSPRFSESPPVSPISWRMDEISEGQKTFAESSAFHKKMSCLEQNSTIMEEVSEESISYSGSSEDICGNEKVKLQILSKGTNHRGPLTLMRNLSDMDVDSHPFLEGSTMDEVDCGQDTGYHTGISSLQSTNYSLQTTQNLGISQLPELKIQPTVNKSYDRINEIDLKKGTIVSSTEDVNIFNSASH